MSMYAIGGLVTCVRVRRMGEGVNLCHFGAYVLIE